jgi:hypothetical protein
MYWLHTLAVAGILPLLASAHMQMHDPFPINSQEDPAVPENLKDYGYTSPLEPNGSNFPCKGYHKQETSHVSKATYKAGETAKMTIKAPGAAHGGGSCQISLSYDNGETWKAIKSMIGGCPVTLSYDFTIPQDAPSSKDVLLAWTWFNLVGNREMYMNCARVTVEGSAPGRHRRAQLANRESALSSLPDMFTCNLGKGCTTKENQNVEFPDPGADVLKGDNSMTTNGGTGFDGSSAAAGGASGGASGDASGGSSDGASGGSSGSGAPPSAAPAPGPAPSADAPGSAGSAPFPNTTSSAGSPAAGAASPSGSNVVVPISPAQSSAAPAAPSAPASAPSASAPAAPSPAAGGSCTPGSIVCDSPTTWSMCVPGTGGSSSLTSMGAVAPGTTCVDGKIA